MPTEQATCNNDKKCVVCYDLSLYDKELTGIPNDIKFDYKSHNTCDCYYLFPVNKCIFCNSKYHTDDCGLHSKWWVNQFKFN